MGRRSESGFLAEIRREWPRLFPSLPHPSEVNRRARWLYGAYEQIRQAVLGAVPADDWGQIDTSALPVKHPSRVRGPDSWTGPNELCARFGRDAAHGEWFYGFRLAVRTDLGSRLVRSWAIVPAAVNERASLRGACQDGGRVSDSGMTIAEAPRGVVRPAHHRLGVRAVDLRRSGVGPDEDYIEGDTCPIIARLNDDSKLLHMVVTPEADPARIAAFRVTNRSG